MNVIFDNVPTITKREVISTFMPDDMAASRESGVSYVLEALNLEHEDIKDDPLEKLYDAVTTLFFSNRERWERAGCDREKYEKENSTWLDDEFHFVKAEFVHEVTEFDEGGSTRKGSCGSTDSADDEASSDEKEASGSPTMNPYTLEEALKLFTEHRFSEFEYNCMRISKRSKGVDLLPKYPDLKEYAEMKGITDLK